MECPPADLEPLVAVAVMERVTTLMVAAYTKLSGAVLPGSYVGEHMQGVEGVYTAMLQSQERFQGCGVLKRLATVILELALNVWRPLQLQPGSDVQSFVYLRLCLILFTIAANVPSLRPSVLKGLDLFLGHVVQRLGWHLKFLEWRPLCRVMPQLAKDPSTASELLVKTLQQIGEAWADPFLVLTTGKTASISRWETRLRSVHVLTRQTAQGPEVFTLAALGLNQPQVSRHLQVVAIWWWMGRGLMNPVRFRRVLPHIGAFSGPGCSCACATFAPRCRSCGDRGSEIGEGEGTPRLARPAPLPGPQVVDRGASGPPSLRPLLPPEAPQATPGTGCQVLPTADT